MAHLVPTLPVLIARKTCSSSNSAFNFSAATLLLIVPEHPTKSPLTTHSIQSPELFRISFPPTCRRMWCFVFCSPWNNVGILLVSGEPGQAKSPNHNGRQGEKNWSANAHASPTPLVL